MTESDYRRLRHELRLRRVQAEIRTTWLHAQCSLVESWAAIEFAEAVLARQAQPAPDPAAGD